MSVLMSAKMPTDGTRAARIEAETSVRRRFEQLFGQTTACPVADSGPFVEKNKRHSPLGERREQRFRPVSVLKDLSAWRSVVPVARSSNT
jgi:hypothetical protein